MSQAVVTTPPPDDAHRRRARRVAEEADLKEFRELMPRPDHWEDGFGIKSMIGAVFVGMVMTPASMYMSLIMGADVGSAAQWVTVILFMEVARRSFTTLSRAEIYVLYYMAGAALVKLIGNAGTAGLLWGQFLAQSESYRQFGITVPPWVSPTSPDVLGTRSLFHAQWLAPIGLMAMGMFLTRLDNFGLGYVMYRLTSDVEKLPFPMGPVGAQGVTALADASGGKETWRWRVFSFGAMGGVAFGAVYLALPAITGAFLPEPISVFPLPFKDLTPYTESYLPAVPIMLSFNLGSFLVGMVLPFWAMVGAFIGLIVMLIANPVMYRYTDVLGSWRPGVGAIRTMNSNTLDFYFSFGLGLTAAIIVIGLWSMGKLLLKSKRQADEAGVPGLQWRNLFNPPEGRGDISIWVGLLIYVFSTGATIVVSLLLMRWAHLTDPSNGPITPLLVGVLLFYGFVYTPLIAYVQARMEGIVGLTVPIPFVREATFMLSGYKGTAIWFTSFPAYDYGLQALYFRQTELTGTSFRSMIKAEAFIFPVTLVSALVFTQFIWSIAPVPSSAFPYASQFWEMIAFRQSLIISATMPGGEGGAFQQAFHVSYLLVGLVAALGLYGVLSFFGLPVVLVYGIIRGLDQASPDVIIPQFLGAMFGRYYFAKKFGSNWPQYRVVFLAGFGCGMGLIMMFALGVVFMSKSVFQSTF